MGMWKKSILVERKFCDPRDWMASRPLRVYLIDSPWPTPVPLSCLTPSPTDPPNHPIRQQVTSAHLHSGLVFNAKKYRKILFYVLQEADMWFLLVLGQVSILILAIHPFFHPFIHFLYIYSTQQYTAKHLLHARCY